MNIESEGMIMSTENYKGFKITVEQDEHAESPRTAYDELGRMICFHKRYDLGDSHDYNSDDYSSWEELENDIIKKEKPLVMLDIYLYDHSGITIKTSPFGCSWDSGRIGVILVNEEDLKKFGVAQNEKESREEFHTRLQRYLENEVKTYDKYLRGEVFYYSVESACGEIEDSCYGFYGYEECLSEAKSIVDYHINCERLAKQKKLKAQIKNSAPLYSRGV